MKEKVEEVLGMVRPMLVRDGGDVELTLKMGIEKILKEEIPGVKEVVAVD